MTRAEKLAKALLEAPDPVYAIAHFIGEQDARIDAIARNVTTLQQQIADLHDGYRPKAAV